MTEYLTGFSIMNIYLAKICINHSDNCLLAEEIFSGHQQNQNPIRLKEPAALAGNRSPNTGRKKGLIETHYIIEETQK